MSSGAELFVDALERHEIRDIFTLVGDHLNEVLLCAGRRGIRIVDMRHESAVVHAADAWARIHRRPSVSLVTGGPGHTNALTGVATAFLAGSPVITVSGARPSTQAHRNAFQDVDQFGMIAPVVKWAAEPPAPAQIPFYFERALAEAVSGRSGPVHLTVPVDVFAGEGSAAVPPIFRLTRPAPANGDVDRAAAMLRQAHRPVVVAGAGVWWSGAERQLAAFAELTSAPVFTVSLARGAMPDSHPLCFGYADPTLNRAAARTFAAADLVIVLGKRIDSRLGMGGPRVFPDSVKVIQVDIHAPELGMNRRLDLGICADIGATLDALIESNPSRPRDGWLETVRGFQRDWRSWLEAEARDQSAPIHPAALFTELRSALAPGVLYSWDGGDFAHWGRSILPADVPGGWVRLGPLATIGAALPNALALQLANPGKPVALITGDGALGFYIAEFDTAVRYKLPIVFIVGNDAGWGLERELQSWATGDRHTVACELRRTRYDLVMQGFGGEGETIDTIDQIAPAVRRAFAAKAPYCLNVNIRGVRSPFTDWQIAGKSSSRRS